MQDFTTADVLLLELLDDPQPAAGGMPRFRQYVPNPDGELGGWGWLSPLDRTIAFGDSSSSSVALRTVVAQSGVYFTTEPMPVKAGATHASTTAVVDATTTANVGIRTTIDYLDDTLEVLGSSAASALATAGGFAAHTAAGAFPAGTAYLRLRVDLYRSGASALNAGDTARVGPVYLVQGTGAELTAAASSGYVLEDGWTNILGPTFDLDLDRSELNLGILKALIYGPELDPATADTIRKGKKIRAVAVVFGQREELFTGEVLNAVVDYDLLHPDENRRTKITLTAVDRVNALGNIGREDGVALISETPYLLEGAGLPWLVNGNDGHADPTPAVVSRNANAKLIDQLAITRDSALGYAWVSRRGVVNVWDAADLGTSVPTVDLDETVYAGAEVDYDTDRCINEVTLVYLRLDPVTGDTEEVTYGPFVDLASRDEWGAHAATFTVHGLEEDPATFQAFADAVLAANATPGRRLNKATIYLRDLDTLAEWVTSDIYDLRRVRNDRAGILADQRITGVRHHITASLWSLELEFSAEGGVAAPQAVPSPPASPAQTLAQLLRPVGECTLMLGLPSQVWPGWLVLNGAALTAGEYPELEAWLAAAGLPTNVLPDLTDRIVVGAGIKALGATSGQWTKTITAGQLPAHVHTAGTIDLDSSNTVGSGNRVARGSSTSAGRIGAGISGNTGNGPGNGDPLDITPPVFAGYWVIRARSGA